MFTLKKPILSGGGGGYHFVANLHDFLKNNGYEVIFHLEPAIDIIFIIDPRKNRTNKYSLDSIIKYKEKNPNVKLIHRVNECDVKREISINIEPLLLKAMKVSDHVVFISKWLQSYFIQKYKLKLKSSSYILNGCNRKYFYPRTLALQPLEKIKLVTHHWSNNYLKGFHIYNKLDKLLANHKNIEFTFIGNYNKNYQPKNIKLIKSKNSQELGDILRKHNIYITATQNEPCGMHHIEGLSCGLPILYGIGGGAIKEACKDRGEEFNNIDNLFKAINKIQNNYKKYVENIDYEYLGSDRCCQEYLKLIQTII